MPNVETIELESDYIVLSIPKDTVEVEINATIWKDGATQKVTHKMGLAEVRDAFKDAEMNYIDPDAKFSITGKGLAYLDGLKAD